VRYKDKKWTMWVHLKNENERDELMRKCEDKQSAQYW